MNKGTTDRLYGNYRAKVVSNVDKNKYGRVLVWIPDLMPGISEDRGIWASPANNPIGGRNKQSGSDENYYMGTSFIPRRGSWVWIFFECGQIHRPYYFGALDIENTKVLPECQLGNNYQDKWVLFKSHDGRTVVISDDPDDARVEITGKKRQITEPPTGDTSSVYNIDENQTTILLDERSGKEKILIRTYKGDFVHLDIDEQNLNIYVKNNIEIKCDGDLKITAGGSINFNTSVDDLNIEAGGSINIKSDSDIKQDAGGNLYCKAGGNGYLNGSGSVHIKGGGTVNIDGSILNEQSGAAISATGASSATSADPKGERNT